MSQTDTNATNDKARPGLIAVASGKGGTGKTTVAANLARVSTEAIQLMDCDVEEPNCRLFLSGEVDEERPVTVPHPVVDGEKCTGCGACSKACQFNAIVSLGSQAMVFPELCHACGACALVCPENAITEDNREIGMIRMIKSGQVELAEGMLNVGSMLAPPVIRAVKGLRKSGATVLLDAPPGTSCPVVETLRGSDYVVLVTEPTPFGLHDLGLALDMVEEMGLPCGVVVNRAEEGNDSARELCEARGVRLLMEIPEDRRIAEAYSRGDLMVEALPEYCLRFEELLQELHERVAKSKQEASTA
ncbi:MAG: ATP-binding protein [Candidatus Sumerlaeota bacterium]